MRKILTLLFASPLLVVMIAIVFINVRVYYEEDSAASTTDSINEDLVHTLYGIKDAVNAGADTDMQAIYPEGHVFMNVIYALAWCNAMEKLNTNSEYYRTGYSEIQMCWAKINSKSARTQFEEDLPLAYGAFYTGWSNYLLGRKLSLEPPDQRDPTQIQLFKSNCERIAHAIQANPFPVSYYAQAWPADVMPCVASLRLHDQILEAKYKAVVEKWLKTIVTKLDPNGLIPHAVNPLTGKTVESARGSSQSLMLIFLQQVDRELAQAHYQKYKKLFLDTTFGLSGIREYPKGHSGEGDVDSGPVILGYGGAATIVGMQTLSAFGDDQQAAKIRNEVEGLAFGITAGGKKKYFFGTLPMADAFIAWSHTALNKRGNETPSFGAFHLYSSLVFFVGAIWFWILMSPRKPDSKASMNTVW